MGRKAGLGREAAHHFVGEVRPARAEVDHVDTFWELALVEQLRDRAAEAVVAHPRIADPGD